MEDRPQPPAATSQEPPGGWDRPVGQLAHPREAYAVKRPLGRVVGFTVLSFGLYGFWWLYVNRKLIDAELGHGRDEAAVHTLGYAVPILNFFVLHWLWRDINQLRVRVGLPEFPAAAYLAGSIFLAPVFFGIVLNRLNEYWDVRTQGLATEAPVTTGEKVVVAAGVALWLLWFALIVLAVVISIGISAAG